MNKSLCRDLYCKLGYHVKDGGILWNNFLEMLEEIEETLNFSQKIGGYPAIHCIEQSDIGWKMITIDDEDGFQDLTYCIMDVFGLEKNGGFAKSGNPQNIVRELALMLEMPIAFDFGENTGYAKTDVEEDWLSGDEIVEKLLAKQKTVKEGFPLPEHKIQNTIKDLDTEEIGGLTLFDEDEDEESEDW